MLIVDNLQYNNWSEDIFSQISKGKVSAIHATIAYHENFVETIANIVSWNKMFDQFKDKIFQGFSANDITHAYNTNRCAIFFGFQNPSPIEDDIGLVEIWHRLGVRFMQLSYNNQSLLATGCYELNDPGITRMGKEIIREMNRVGMVIDMSHSSEYSSLQAIETSQRPIVISHANPSSWFNAKRNKSDTLLKALAQSGGMLGFSIYPHHLKDGSSCSLESFCSMIAKTVELMGIESVGLGSDLCQNQPDSIVEWMRNGTWSKTLDFGEGSSENPGFPKMPTWFKNNNDFQNIQKALKNIGFNQQEVEMIMGKNWLEFYKKSFSPSP